MMAAAIPALAAAQATAPAAPATAQKPSEAEDKDRTVAGGGVMVPGWTGKVDAKGAASGLTLKDSKFEPQGDAIHLTVGPATTYWNPANTVKGDYTVKGTFTEPKQDFSHPHPMGLFIGGSKLGTPDQALMYCVAYRNGTFLIRRFNGDTVTNVVPRTPNDAIKKAATKDDSVTQEIAWVVKGQGGLRDQRRHGGVAAGGRHRRARQAGVHGRHLGDPRQSQHGPDGVQAVSLEELR